MLVSFSRDNNAYFLFLTNKCLIKCQVFDAILLECRVGADGLYEFPFINVSDSAKSLLNSSILHFNNIVPIANVVSISCSLPYVRHLRLGHSN